MTWKSSTDVEEEAKEVVSRDLPHDVHISQHAKHVPYVVLLYTCLDFFHLQGKRLSAPVCACVRGICRFLVPYSTLAVPLPNPLCKRIHLFTHPSSSPTMYAATNAYLCSAQMPTHARPMVT